MKSLIFIIVFFTTIKVFAACDDLPAKEVDWTGCNFVENQEWSGASLVGAQMEKINLSLANLEKSQIV